MRKTIHAKNLVLLHRKVRSSGGSVTVHDSFETEDGELYLQVELDRVDHSALVEYEKERIRG